MKSTLPGVLVLSRRALGLSLIASVLALGSPEGARAAGPGDVDRAEIAFQLGNEAVLRRDFRNALQHYFESNALAPNRAVLFNIARCYDSLGEAVEAYRYYLEHLALALPEDKTVETAQAALQRLASNVALFEVTSDPPGATIYVDRRELGSYGVTPRTIPLEPGEHLFLLEAPHHDPASARAEAQLGATARVMVALPWRHGTVVLQGRPEGAEVRVDDPKAPVVARLPATIRLTEGTRVVTVQHPGHVPQRTPIEVRAGESMTLDVRIEVESGTLLVQADEAGAVIQIDGEPAGFTPAVIDRVPVGRHRVTVTFEGYAPYVADVDVTADARVSVDAVLAVGTEVITASRSLETIAEAPASVSIIPGLEIRAFGYDTLVDALRGTPGLYTTDDRVYPSFGVRGMSLLGDYGSHVQIQIDGHTMNDDWIGSTYTSFDLLAGLQPVERIEVVRGPASNLYGTGAMFGVVNLITPDAIDELRVRSAIGIAGAQTMRAQTDATLPFGGAGDGLWLYGGATYRQPGTYYSQVYADGDGAGDGTLTGVDENLSFTTLGKLLLGELTLKWYWNDQDHQIPTGPYDALPGDTGTHYADRRIFVDLAWEHALSADSTIVARVAWDRYRYLDHFAYADEDGGPIVDTWDSDWTTTELRLSSELVDGFALTAGAEWQFHFFNHTYGATTADGEAFIDLRNPFHVLSAYVSFDLEATDWLHVSGGARVDGWIISDLPQVDGTIAERTFSSVNPRLALRFDASPDDVIKVLFARGFRAPSVYELAYNDGGATTLPSPELVPEVVWSTGLEYLRELGGGLSLSVATYFNRYQELIAVETTEDELLQWQNGPDVVSSLGGEIELRRVFQRGLMWSLGYGIQHTRQGDVADGARLANSPVHAFAGKLVLPLVGRELALTSRLTIESARKDRAGLDMPWIALWDVGLWGQVPKLDFEYCLSVRNALDWGYSHALSDENPDTRTRAPGAELRAELRARF